MVEVRTNGVNKDWQVASGVALLQAAQDGLHVRIIVRIDLEIVRQFIAKSLPDSTYDRENDVRLGCKILENVEVLNGPNGSLQSECLELLRLFFSASERSDLQRLC